MKVYKIDAVNYFNKIENAIDTNVIIDKKKESIKEAMQQLINKYNIIGKNIISLGSQHGYEEMWFYRNCNQTTLSDISTNAILLQSVKEINTTNNLIEFIIGNCYDLPSLNKKWDVVFASCLPAPVVLDTISFSDRFLKLINEILLDKGLFIIQQNSLGFQYSIPVNIINLRKRLFEHGFELIDYYYFESYPNVSLTIVLKGTKLEANAFLKKIENNPEITRFHGRSDLITKIIKGVF